MRIANDRKLYLPALSIVAGVVVLLVVVGFSTFQNLSASRMRALELLHRQGVAIVRALEAGVRAGLVSPARKKDSIARLLVETVENEDVAYVYLMDSSGFVEHHSNPSMAGEKSDWKPEPEKSEDAGSRIVRFPDKPAVYEVAERFLPYDTEDVESESVADGPDEVERNYFRDRKGSVIVVGLRMSHFEQARSEDMHHAFVMVAIVAALGSGALFFLFVIQNYYSIDKTLKQTRDYARQLVASMPSGLVGIDGSGKILSCNQSALDLLGLDENKVRGARMQNVVDFGKTGVGDTLNSGMPVLDKEIFHERSDGEKIPLALSATPIWEESGKCGGAVLIFMDLREIKRLEKKVRQAEKFAAIGQLSAAVAHEIRNPLSSIRGFAKFLVHVLKDRPKDREYAEIMVKEIDRINQVVNDLLTFARPLKTNRKPADIADVVDHAVRLIGPELASKKVRIRKEVDENLDKAHLDKDQVVQVLLNLLLNAVSAAPPDSEIAVGAACGRGKTTLEVWVEDEGPGVPSEKQKSIFDPFHTTKEKGASLGLSIVKKIVENHEGKVFIESPPAGKSRGARVGFRIPVQGNRVVELDWNGGHG